MIRSARLRFPSIINLLTKRATLRLLNLASGTSGRRTTFLRLGKSCLLHLPGLRPREMLSSHLASLHDTRTQLLIQVDNQQTITGWKTPEKASIQPGDIYLIIPDLLRTPISRVPFHKIGEHSTINVVES